MLPQYFDSYQKNRGNSLHKTHQGVCVGEENILR